MAALPDKAPAKPRQPRKVLVLAKAAGFVHSCIPLAAKTVEALGRRPEPGPLPSPTIRPPSPRRTWRSTTSYSWTTPRAPSSTIRTMRRPPNPARARCSSSSGPEKAWPEFTLPAIPTMNPAPGGSAPAPGGRGGPGATLAAQMMTAGDKDGDRKLSGAELNALADAWFEKTRHRKRRQGEPAEFRRAPRLGPAPGAAAGPATVPQGRDNRWAPGPNSTS